MNERTRAYIELTKPRIVTMVLVTAVLGFFLGVKFKGIEHSILTLPAFWWMLVGTWCTSSGASVLNQYIERDVDGLMKRTKRRPLPTGVIEPGAALSFGILLVLSGVSLLVAEVNLLTGFLSLLTCFLYVIVYTPLKRVTWLNTFIGAIPGALPPMGGWTAATGTLDPGAWVLFAILFIWQHPHFYAIAWMYREDYSRGGFKMLPVIEPDGKSTFRQIVLYSLLLLPVSVLPTLIGVSGTLYFWGACVLGVVFLVSGVRLARTHSHQHAKSVLKTSVVYLPLLLALLICDVRL